MVATVLEGFWPDKDSCNWSLSKVTPLYVFVVESLDFRFCTKLLPKTQKKEKTFRKGRENFRYADETFKPVYIGKMTMLGSKSQDQKWL